MTTEPRLGRACLVIDGKLVDTDRYEPVIDPATEAVIGEAPLAAPHQVDAAVSAAQAAFVTWRADRGARNAAMLAAADALDGAAGEIASLITAENGKPLAESSWEVSSLAAFLRYQVGVEAPRQVLRDDDSAFVEVVHRPMGPVGAITPWNAPVYVAGIKLAPALAAGNTVILKPSPFTPLSSLRVGEVLQTALPPGVVNVINGDGEVGAAMTAHPGLRAITLTGSTATGRAVAMSAAGDLKRVTLELGGNDPAVLLDDFDVERFGPALFWAAMRGTGQACVAVKRVYAPRSKAAAVTEFFTELARTAVVGDGRDPQTQLGPLTTKPQLDRVTSLVDDARARGAQITVGGHRIDRPGYFYAPTVVTEVADGTAIVDEEQFGPVLPVIAYDDEEDAIERANAGNYGLGASVWSPDVPRAAGVAERLEAGAVWVNAHRVTLGAAQPSHGWKHSGVGTEKGLWGLLSFTELQVRHQPRQ